MKNDRYDIWTTAELTEYEGPGPVTVGMITDGERGNKLVSLIVYDRDDHLDNLYRIRTVDVIRDGERSFDIVLGDQYREILAEKPKVFEAIAMHELGHFVNNHMQKNEERFKGIPIALGMQILRDEREQGILSGNVDPPELEADEFACSMVGKHAMNMMFDLLIRLRRERGDDAAPLAIREFELRKKAVRNLRI